MTRLKIPSASGQLSSSKTTDPPGLLVRLTVQGLLDPRAAAKTAQLAIPVTTPAGSSDEAFPSPRQRATAVRRLMRGVSSKKLASDLAAMAHDQRIRILHTLLVGEATHKTLARATNLQAGPLYYHIRELRAAKLIGPKVRDLYHITPKGEAFLLAVLAMRKLAR